MQSFLKSFSKQLAFSKNNKVFLEKATTYVHTMHTYAFSENYGISMFTNKKGINSKDCTVLDLPLKHSKLLKVK